MIRTLGIFKRHKISIEEKAHALHLYVAGPSSWGMADAMGGSLREEAVPLICAQPGARSVDRTAEGEEARRGGLERDRGEGERPGGPRLGRHQCGYRGAPGDKGVMPSGR